MHFTIRRLVVAASFLVPLAGAAPASARSMDVPGVIRTAVEKVIRPGYAGFHEKTTAMSAAATALCKAPSAEALKTARAAFSDTVDAWSRIEFIRVGPVMDDHRMERILFWPDRKSIGLKQVQAVLADKDPTASTAEQVGKKSVAAQGLGALEYVLFGTGSETLEGSSEPFRCTYGQAIAGNLDAMAGELQAAWDDPKGFAAIWETPGPDNRHFRNNTEALGELVDTIVQGIEFTRDVRLKAFLRDTPAEDKPRLAVFWRSEKTIDSLRGNIDGMRALFEESGFAAGVPADAHEAARSVSFEFSNALRGLDVPRLPLDELLKDQALRDKIIYFRLVSSSLTNLIGTDLAGILGLSAGFSSLDGD